MAIIRWNTQRPLGILFDLDGVLIDSREHHYQAFRELAEEHGIDLTPSRFDELFGLSNNALVPQLFGKPLPVEQVTQLGEKKETRFRALIRDSAMPIPGAVELVRWFKDQGMGLAVASSAPRANVEQILRSIHVRDLFDAVLTAEDVTRHKPEPDVFLTAAQHISIEAKDAWVIEDSHHGLEAARRAGAFSIGVATTHPADSLTADEVFPGLVELLHDLAGK